MIKIYCNSPNKAELLTGLHCQEVREQVGEKSRETFKSKLSQVPRGKEVLVAFRHEN